MYVLIHPSEDGVPLYILQEPIEEFLNNAQEITGTREFKDVEFFKENDDPNYWSEGQGVLLEVKVVVPKPVTSRWELP